MATDVFPHLLQPTCAQCAGIGIRNVPRLLWDMEDDCGEDVLIAFLRVHGGREYSIPVTAPTSDETDPLSVAVSWLHRNHGPGRLMVPLGPASYQSRLAWTIYARLSEGASLATIVKELHCDMRTVCGQKKRLTALGALPVPPRSLPKPNSDERPLQ